MGLPVAGIACEASAIPLAADSASAPAYSAESGGAWKGANPSPGENAAGADDGGFGFTPWDFSGGYHYPQQSPYGALNHFMDGVDFPASSFNNLGSPAFGLTNANVAFGGATASATRAFDKPLAIGDTFSLNFDNPQLDPLNQFAPSGFLIRLNSGFAPAADDGSNERFAILAQSNFNDGAWAAADSADLSHLGIPSSITSQGATFRFTLTGPESYFVEIAPSAGGHSLATRSGNLAHPGAGPISAVQLVMYENGSGDGQFGPAAQPTGAHEFFFDNLTIAPSDVRGDFDVDGDVDGSDLLKWQRGQSPRPLSALDLVDWKAGYGAMSFPKLALSSVPEPGIGRVLACAGVAILLVGRGAGSWNTRSSLRNPASNSDHRREPHACPFRTRSHCKAA